MRQTARRRQRQLAQSGGLAESPQPPPGALPVAAPLRQHRSEVGPRLGRRQVHGPDVVAVPAEHRGEAAATDPVADDGDRDPRLPRGLRDRQPPVAIGRNDVARTYLCCAISHSPTQLAQNAPISPREMVPAFARQRSLDTGRDITDTRATTPVNSRGVSRARSSHAKGLGQPWRRETRTGRGGRIAKHGISRNRPRFPHCFAYGQHDPGRGSRGHAGRGNALPMRVYVVVKWGGPITCPSTGDIRAYWNQWMARWSSLPGTRSE